VRISLGSIESSLMESQMKYKQKQKFKSCFFQASNQYINTYLEPIKIFHSPSSIEVDARNQRQLGD